MSENRYIMILGAGLMQRPSIEAARQLGYKTLVVDANPNALCAGFADRFEPIDLKDKEALADLALSMGKALAAVFTAGTDFSASVAYVAEKCSLPSHTFEAAMNASNKALMRECFEKNGIPSPKFSVIERANLASYLAENKLSEMKWPLVVKPVDNMGGRGCRLVRSKEEFLPAIEEAILNSRSSRAILEDYMQGAEFSIDAIVYKDTLTITGFADRHIFYEPYFIEMGHTLPSRCTDEIKYALFTTFAKAVKALGLTCGAAKADIKFTSRGPMVGEIAARLSGGYMSGWTFPYSSNVDLTRQAILVALGKAPDELLQKRRPLPLEDVPFTVYEVPSTQVSAERAWISIPGTVSEVYGTDKAAAYPFVRNLFSRAESGSKVQFPRNNVQKCGNVITFASDTNIAASSAEEAVSQIVLRLKPNTQETDSFLRFVCAKDESNFPPSAYELTETQRLVIEQCISRNPRIKENQKIEDLLADFDFSFADFVFDYNHRTLKQTVRLFDRLCPEHPEMDSSQFWNALLRGGIQGILYTADCIGEM